MVYFLIICWYSLHCHCWLFLAYAYLYFFGWCLQEPHLQCALAICKPNIQRQGLQPQRSGQRLDLFVTPIRGAIDPRWELTEWRVETIHVHGARAIWGAVHDGLQIVRWQRWLDQRGARFNRGLRKWLWLWIHLKGGRPDHWPKGLNPAKHRFPITIQWFRSAKLGQPGAASRSKERVPRHLKNYRIRSIRKIKEIRSQHRNRERLVIP